MSATFWNMRRRKHLAEKGAVAEKCDKEAPKSVEKCDGAATVPSKRPKKVKAGEADGTAKS